MQWAGWCHPILSAVLLSGGAAAAGERTACPRSSMPPIARLALLLHAAAALFPPTQQPDEFNATEQLEDFNQVADTLRDEPEPLYAPQTPPGYTLGERAYMHLMETHTQLEKLRGKTLRVIVPTLEPPYVNYVNFTDEAVKEMGYGPGIVIELLKEIGKTLDLRYEVLNVTNIEWGSSVNGTWTGGFGYLNRGEADILAGATIMQYDRSLIADLTYPFQYELTGMLIRSPEKYNDNTLLIVTEPFKWQVWGLTAISIFVSGIVLKALTTSLGKVYSEVHYNLFDSIWVFFSIFVQQGLPVQPHSWSCRVMLSLWWLASITLMATFTGSLVALFAVDKTYLPFTTLEGMVKQVKAGKYTVLLNVNTKSRTDMIKNSAQPIYKELWRQMSNESGAKYVDGLENGVQALKAQTGYVLLGPYHTLSFYEFADCKLQLLNEGVLPTYLSIPLAKNSPYSTYFSTKIREMVERGFIEKWINDYRTYMASQKTTKCNETTSTTRGYLDLSRAQGAFWVLIGGIVIAIALLVLELAYRFVRKKFFNERTLEISGESGGGSSEDAESVENENKEIAMTSTSGISVAARSNTDASCDDSDASFSVRSTSRNESFSSISLASNEARSHL